MGNIFRSRHLLLAWTIIHLRSVVLSHTLHFLWEEVFPSQKISQKCDQSSGEKIFIHFLTFYPLTMFPPFPQTVFRKTQNTKDRFLQLFVTRYWKTNVTVGQNITFYDELKRWKDYNTVTMKVRYGWQLQLKDENCLKLKCDFLKLQPIPSQLVFATLVKRFLSSV